MLKQVAHRPRPIARRPWTMAQIWHHLFFAHWPVHHDALRPLVPPELPLDMFEGSCWVAVAPFHMSGVCARGLPALPGLSRFPELNVRTYVRVDDKAGVYFFSLDAGNRAAVWGDRNFYKLPYFCTRIHVATEGALISYASRRERGEAEFSGQYRPIGGAHERHS